MRMSSMTISDICILKKQVPIWVAHLFFFGSSSPRSIGHKDGEEKLVQITGLTFKSSTSEI